ncbi:hypothetical protein JCM6292_2819 [Bacteroides pyogenes JCM 6292]|uniref:Uncharacterized protein n=1 Tax=Bacteroides pyogenes JCM 6292 TaxID=1235809 RepID=W4PAJ0_9BACE|nr:hypothetical protein JCM6292_2819 [Bacteroides pyogenes JCM 6292]
MKMPYQLATDRKLPSQEMEKHPVIAGKPPEPMTQPLSFADRKLFSADRKL